MTDVFCILHPASTAACIAIAKVAPGHTISTSDLAVMGKSLAIALRFSATLKQPLLGFCFERYSQRCDCVLANIEGVKRISNVHFRIYISDQGGAITLEDQSTNGTLVDDILLRSEKHVLQQGSLITLIMTPSEENIKFVVQIPQYEGEYKRQYHQNLDDYVKRLERLRQPDVKRITPAQEDRGVADVVS